LNLYLRERTLTDKSLSAPVGPLYRDYRSWCSDGGIQPIRRKSFVHHLRAAGYAVELTETHRTVAHGLGMILGARPMPPFLVLPEGLTGTDRKALALMAGELARIRTVEGFTAERDDAYPLGELETAGGEYLTHAGYHRRAEFPPGSASDSWPWSAEWWKPVSPIRDAVRGIALGLAGVSRRLRAGERAEG